MGTHSAFVWIMAALVAVGAVGRATRFIVHDHYPGMDRLRGWWIGVTRGGAWSLLIGCHFCVPPYVAAVDVAAAVIWDLPFTWWLINAWLALSYAASILVSYDEPAPEE
jgi:hypothetical protein